MGLRPSAARLLAAFRRSPPAAPPESRNSRLIDQLIDHLIEDACNAGAADLHLQPTEDKLLVYRRSHGRCHCKTSLPKSAGPDLVGRLIAMSNLSPWLRGFPQEGRLMGRKFSTRRFDLRLSTAPVLHGEAAVIRIRAQPEPPIASAAPSVRPRRPLAWLLRILGRDPWHQRSVYQGMDRQEVSRNLHLIKRHLNRGGSSESYAPFVGELQQRSTQPEDIEFAEPGYLEAVQDLNLFLQIPSATAEDLLQAFAGWHAAATQRLLEDEYRSEMSHRTDVAALLASVLGSTINGRNVYRIAGSLYYDLHKLHPFAGGGNHRAIILLINYVLIKNGRTPFYLKPINFSSYKTLTAEIRSPKGESAIKAELEGYFRKNCPAR